MYNEQNIPFTYFANTSTNNIDIHKSIDDNIKYIIDNDIEHEIAQETSGEQSPSNDFNEFEKSRYYTLVKVFDEALKNNISIEANKKTRKPNSEKMLQLMAEAPVVNSAFELKALPSKKSGSMYPVFFKIKKDCGDFRKNHIWFAVFLAIFSVNNSIKELTSIFKKWCSTQILTDKEKALYLLEFKEDAGNDFANIETILKNSKLDIQAYQERLASIANVYGLNQKAASLFLALMGDTMSPALDGPAWSYLIDNGYVDNKIDCFYNSKQTPYYGEKAEWTSTKEMISFVEKEKQFKKEMAKLKKELSESERGIGLGKITDQDVYDAFPKYKKDYDDFVSSYRRAKSDNKLILLKLFKNNEINTKIMGFSDGIEIDEIIDENKEKVIDYIKDNLDGWDGNEDSFWDWYSTQQSDGKITEIQKEIVNSELFKSIYPKLFEDDQFGEVREIVEEDVDHDIDLEKNSWYFNVIKYAASDNVHIPEKYIPTINSIIEKAKSIGLTVYAIGGFVRDLLIGKKEPKDLDVMVDVTDSDLYFSALSQIEKNIRSNPYNFIQTNLAGAKQLTNVKDFKIEQSQKRKEFFRITALIDYVDNSTKNKQEFNDVPFESSLNPSFLLALQFGRRVPRGESFGIYAVGTDIGEVEIAYPRSETYEVGSRKPRTDMGTMQEDANRRDFAMNALYLNLETNELTDPTGHGLYDIQHGIISITDPSAMETIFNDDPLRLLRLIRFSAVLGFQIDPQIIEYVKQHPYLIAIKGDAAHSSGFEAKLSSERIAEEFRKIMSSTNAPQAIDLMKKLGMLDVVLQMPEHAKSLDMEHLNKHHYQNVWDHTITVMKELQKNIVEAGITDPETIRTLNFSALFHDIGKVFPETGHQDVYDKSGTFTTRRFVGHPIVSTQEAIRIMKRLKFSNDEISKVSKIVESHDEVLGLKTSIPAKLDKELAKLINILGNDVYLLIELGRADRRAHVEGTNDDTYLLDVKKYLTPEKFAEIKSRLKPFINGNELFAFFPNGYAKDNWIGLVLRYLIDLQVSQKIRNKDEAICFASLLTKILSIIKQQPDNRIGCILKLFDNITDFCAYNTDDMAKKIVIEKYKNIQGQYSDLQQPFVNGNELMQRIKENGYDVKPGQWMATILKTIFEKQINGELTDKEEAMQEAYEMFLKSQNNATLSTMEKALLKISYDIEKENKKKRKRVKADPNPVRKNRFNNDDSIENVGPGGKGYRGKSNYQTMQQSYFSTTTDTPAKPPISIDWGTNGMSFSAQANPPQGFVKPMQDNKPKEIIDEENPDYKFKFSIPLGWHEGDVVKKHEEDTEKEKEKKVNLFKNETTGDWMSKDYTGKRMFLGTDFPKAFQFINKIYGIKLKDYIGNMQSRRTIGLYDL